ncbi:MAG: threonylcarbamoyl-AMP synthase [Bacteroidaceae bacterium]|nr:threonylcarbamoyl-AMP synthase [Bacteroidaceae bacterium]MBR4648976.1 threonylcarbamoyl-AMP synthase [Bacteroidaceae bacterium]
MRNREWPFDKEDMAEAVRVLKAGGVILYPTDTVWGLGCDATNAEAVERIYRIKQRQDSKALIVLADSEAMISRYVAEVPEVAWDVIELATRPTTVIFDRGLNLAPNLLAQDGSVGIRLSREAFSSQLCFHLRKPIVSTSANVSGQPSPRIFREIIEEIRQQVDYVVRYRQDDIKPASPSSVIKLGRGGEVKIIRE